MTMEASGLHLVAYVFQFLGFLMGGASFFAPFWVFKLNELASEGLWGRCGNHHFSATGGEDYNQYYCIWFQENDFAWENILPEWHKASQALFAFGIVTLFAVLIVASLHLCCRCCQASLSLKGALGGLLIFGGFLIALAVALFGGMSYKDNNTSFNSSISRFDWGFYIGIPGAVLPILAGLFYLIESKRYEGYQRSGNDVV